MKRFLTLFFIFTYGVISAQKLSLEHCRQLALENSYELKILNQERKAAYDKVDIYRTNFFPKISLTGNYLYSNASSTLTIPGGYLPTFTPNLQTGTLDPNILLIKPDGTPLFKEYAFMPDINISLKTGSVYSLGTAAEQAIYFGGKIRTSVKMAKIGTDISSLKVLKSNAEIIASCDNAYFTYLNVRELLKVAHKYKDVVTEFSREMENAYNSGMKSRNDLLKVKVKLNEAELMLLRAQNGEAIAKMNLCRQIGYPMNTYNIDLEDYNDESINCLSGESDVTSRPEYQLLEQVINLKQQEVRITRGEFLPQIAALASYQYLNGLQVNDSKLLDKASFTCGISLKIPIFHWGEGSKKVKSAGIEVEIAQNNLKDYSEKMQLELMHAINSFNEASLEVDLMKNSVVQAEENMMITKNHYDAGLETLGDYLESQTMWQKALADFVNAKSKKHMAYTNYLKASGKLK